MWFPVAMASRERARVRSVAASLAALMWLAPVSLAAAADMAAVAAGVQGVTAPFGIDLSLSGNPFEANVRIPLPGRPDGAAATLTPYVSAGATDPTRGVEASPILSRRDIEASRASQRMDIGAGLNWSLADRIHLFGEVGYQRAREQSYSLFGLEGNRDGTYIKGGFTIRVR